MTDETDALLERYEQLQHEAQTAADGLGDLSESTAQDLASAYREAVSLLEDYRERATGTGDFGGYMEFRTKFTDFVEELDEGLPHREAFEEARDHIDRRRLSDRNFDDARRALEPVAAIVDTLEELESIRDELADVRSSIVAKRRSLIDRRDHLRDLSDVQAGALDAPIEALSSPIERYNDGIEADYRQYIKETPTREVLAAYKRLSYFALLDIEAPPSELAAFLEDHPAGEESISTIREYLTFSRSKLSHYVDDPGHFVGEVGPHSGYLESLSPQPYTIEWPPPPRSTLQWKLRELTQAVDRFATESTMEALRELQSLCRDEERYRHLRSGARLQQELDADERQLVLDGAVQDQLEAVEDAIEAVDAILEDDG